MDTTSPQANCTIRGIRYPVPSATREGVEHTVTEDPATGDRRCTCEASDHPKTRGRCWHLKATAAGVIKPRVRVRPSPQPTSVPAQPAEPPLPSFTRARTSPEGLEAASLLDV